MPRRPLVVDEHLPVTAAEHDLELAKLRRLEARGSLQEAAERQERDGAHRLQDVDLRDLDLEDGEDPLQRGVDRRQLVALEAVAQMVELVQHLLEPELVDLVDDDEEHLVVLRPAGLGALAGEQLVELQVVRVSERQGTLRGRAYRRRARAVNARLGGASRSARCGRARAARAPAAAGRRDPGRLAPPRRRA